MAVRKETIKKQFDEAMSSVLEPGEQVAAGSYTISGPSPWLQGVLGFIGMLALGMRYYYVAVTDRRVLFMKASMWTQRPKGFAFADPKGSVAIHDVDPSALWSHFRYRRPDGKEIRLNFHRMWRDEMETVVRALGASPTQQPTTSAPPPPAP
jgi:hypothetical protein